VEVSLNAATGERLVAEIDRRVMRAAAHLVDLHRIEAPSFHDEVELIQQCSHDAAVLLPNLAHGPGSMLTLGGLLLLLGQIHPVLPLALLLVGIPYLRARRRMEAEKYRSMAEHTRVAREMEYYMRLTLEPTVAHEVRVFALGDFLLRRFRERRDKAMAEVQRVREFVQALAFSGVMALALAGAFLYTVLQASTGHLQVGDLARSFLRDAALVILDEPASALDADAEYQLFQHFRELIAGKTALLISHRLSTVRMADQILVLDGGRIVEAGSHADLMARGGHYASLYQMQAGRYR